MVAAPSLYSCRKSFNITFWRIFKGFPVGFSPVEVDEAFSHNEKHGKDLLFGGYQMNSIR